MSGCLGECEAVREKERNDRCHRKEEKTKWEREKWDIEMKTK